MNSTEWKAAVREQRVARWFDRLGVTRAEKDASLRDHLTDWYQQAVTLNPNLNSIGLGPVIDDDLLDALFHVFLAHAIELIQMDVANKTAGLQDAFRESTRDVVARARLAAAWRQIITAIDQDTFDEDR